MDFKNKSEVMEKHGWFWGLIYDYVNENWSMFNCETSIKDIKQKIALAYAPEKDYEVLKNNNFCYLCAYAGKCRRCGALVNDCTKCLVLPHNEWGCFLEFDQLEECEIGGNLENKTMVLSLINKIRYKKPIEGK